MKYLSLIHSKLRTYKLFALIMAAFANFPLTYAGSNPESDARLTLSGIDGTPKFSETVCPGYRLCFDVFSFGGNQTQKAEMFWDHAIPGAAFMIDDADMPTGHFCWTPGLEDARDLPYVFHVTMKTKEGAEKIFTYSITVPLLRAQVKSTDVSCYGTKDGSAMVQVSGGSGNYIYLWGHSGETTPRVEGLGEGTFAVQVMDDFGCEVSASARILSPKPLLLEAESQHITCSAKGGQAEVLASGGTMPYSYSWIPTGGYGERLEHLPSGVYTAVVTDANGCTAYKQVNISAVLPLAESEERSAMLITETGLSNVLVYPNPSHNQVTVKNISEETVTVGLVNSIGQDVYRTIHVPANLSISIPLDAQSPGIYLVRVQRNEQTEMIRLVKE